MGNDLAKIQEELSSLICLELSGGLDARSQERLDYLTRLYGLEAIDRVRILHRLKEEKEFDYTGVYEEFRRHISARRYFKRLKQGLVAAAVVSLFAGVGWLWQQEREDARRTTTPLQSGTLIIPGHSRAIITLADGKKLNAGKESQKFHHESGSVLTLDSAQAEYTGTTKTGLPVYNIVDIPAGGEYRLILSDGTKVWLNAASTLKFPVNFSGDYREVFLQGEAYFEVTKDKEHPFLVHTSRGQIEVLGTGFNVRDYREEGRVVATLVEGEIVYRPGNDPKHEILLHPGCQVEDKDGSLPVSQQVDVLMYTGWKNGKYIFENTTLEEIMTELSRWYNIEVFYKNEAVKGLHFTGDLERYNNINDFLEFIEIGGNVRFSINGRAVIIE